MENDNDVIHLHQEIDERVDFVTRYTPIGEAHMVDFFTSDHWNNHLHPIVRNDLLQFSEEELHTLDKSLLSVHPSLPCPRGNQSIQNLGEYFKKAKDCDVANSREMLLLEEFIEKMEKSAGVSCCKGQEFSEMKEKINTKEYMCTKKSHEVENMSKLVNNICQECAIKDILDVGSGKGYLSTYLSLQYGLNVVGIDCSETNSSAAATRAEKYVKYWRAHLCNKISGQHDVSGISFHPVTARVDAESDVKALLKDGTADDDEIFSKHIMLTGLHTCGDLCATSLRTFIASEEIKSLCVVGCCYHLLSEYHEPLAVQNCGFPMSRFLQSKGFLMGRNTRMLGLKAPDRIKDTDPKEKEEKSTSSLFYRAVLSVILAKEFQIDTGRKDLRVGKVYSKSSGFVDYVKKSIKKLGLDDQSTSLSDEKIEEYFDEYQKKRKTLLAYNALREAYAPAVEALILLDKLLYLKEQKSDHFNNLKSFLIRLFDPVQSPRCYALVAIKEC